MAYKVFLSHSSRDQGLVISLASLLKRLGIEVFVAEWYLSPGQPLSQKVFAELRAADCVVVLLTGSGVRSQWVQQEIGYALSTSKRVIPLVEKGVDRTTLGALQGVEYVEYDPAQPQESLNRLITFVNSLKTAQVNVEGILVMAGVVLLLLLLTGKQK